ncbi:MAG: DUF2059 domain-containing protein [Pseudomonadota bacterium]
MRHRTVSLLRRSVRRSVHGLLCTAMLTIAGPAPATTPAVEAAVPVLLEELDARGEARKAANIQKLLKLLDVWGTTASLGPVIADEFALSLTSDNPELDQAVSASFRQALLDVLDSDLTNGESLLRQSYADLYDRNFSSTEIEELVAFYASSTGQKYVRQQRHLVNDSAMVLQAWLNGAKERVITRFEELMALSSALDEASATN